MKSRMLDWFPFGFAFLLMLIEFWVTMRSPGPSTTFSNFVAFLPMCFFFVGLAFVQSRKTVAALEARIAQLESKLENKG